MNRSAILVWLALLLLALGASGACSSETNGSGTTARLEDSGNENGQDDGLLEALAAEIGELRTGLESGELEAAWPPPKAGLHPELGAAATPLEGLDILAEMTAAAEPDTAVDLQEQLRLLESLVGPTPVLEELRIRCTARELGNEFDAGALEIDWPPPDGAASVATAPREELARIEAAVMAPDAVLSLEGPLQAGEVGELVGAVRAAEEVRWARAVPVDASEGSGSDFGAVEVWAREGVSFSAAAFAELPRVADVSVQAQPDLTVLDGLLVYFTEHVRPVEP